MDTGIKNQMGQIAMQVLLFSAFAIIILSGLVIWADLNLRTAYGNADQRQAFMVAEAGLEYYRWHLAHSPTDYTDGTGQAGPYIHNYYDKNGTLLGQYELTITPPLTGSTVVTISSKGKLASNPNIEKIIEVKLAKSSFAKYAAVLNAIVRFGEGTEVFGPIHSNGGVRFDGLAHNLVTSAVSSYDDPDHSGANEFGVHTHVAPADPLPPSPVPNRADVFQTGRQFPVPAVDFSGITQTLANIKTDSQASGSYYGPSGDDGYEIVLKTDDKFDIYKVNTLVAAPSGCTNYLSQDGWGTWSINTKTIYQSNQAIPANGLIFVEDNVWVRGQISSARVTVASGRFPDNPSTRSSITVTDDLLYTNYGGQDVISLLAQKNLNIGMISDTDLRVDGALMAQNGRVGRYYYRPPGGGYNRCSPHHTKTVITSYGMIASSQRYGFAYTDGNGYATRNLIYDAQLLFGPPPSFPLTSDTYQQILWKEIK